MAGRPRQEDGSEPRHDSRRTVPGLVPNRVTWSAVVGQLAVTVSVVARLTGVVLTSRFLT